MKDYLTIITVTLLITTVFIAAINIGESSLNNQILDDDSRTLIQDIATKQSEDFSEDQFMEGEDTLAEEDSSFDSEDAFSREFLEGRSEAQQKTNLVERIIGIPSLILLSVGLPESFIRPFFWIVTTLVSIFVSFATYRAFFGGGRITER